MLHPLLLIRVGIVLLTIGMIAVIAGVVASTFFLPGTWIIVVGFLCIAASGVLNVVNATRGGVTDSPDGATG